MHTNNLRRGLVKNAAKVGAEPRKAAASKQ